MADQTTAANYTGFLAEAKAQAHAPIAATSSFHDMLVNHENDRHARRLAEIKRAASKLRMFEPTASALAEKGIHVVNDMPRVDYSEKLLISTGGPTERDNALHAALLELGFAEIDRRISGTYAHCDLKKGRLTVALMIKPSQAAAPASATAAGAA